MNEPAQRYGLLLELDVEDPPHQQQQEQQRVQREQAWFREYISMLLAGNQLSNRMIKVRNWAMIALVIQACATVAGFSFYFIRKVIIRFSLP